MVEAVPVSCPYCGEPLTLAVDPSVSRQEYVEDCHVCCRPMTVQATVDPEGTVSVSVRTDDD